MHTARTAIGHLERAFWQPMVDNDPKVATGAVSDNAGRALHAGAAWSRKCCRQRKWR